MTGIGKGLSGAIAATLFCIAWTPPFNDHARVISTREHTPSIQHVHFLSSDVACACVAPGTPAERVRAAMLLMPDGSPNAASLSNRWTNTATNGTVSDATAITLTYSFVPDIATGDPQTSNEIHARLTGQFGSEAAWKAVFRDVFDRWSAVSGIDFTEVSDDGAPWPGSPGSLGVRGDIRILARPIDGSFNVLAFNYFPNNGDMQLDTAEQWASFGNNHRLFRNTLQHEIGHGLGLDHVNPRDSTKLMEAIISLNFVGPQDDDVRGVQAFYGDSFEPNDNAASRVNVGTFADGAVLAECALHDRDDTDFYFVSANPGQAVEVTVSPVGGSYSVGPDPGTPAAINTTSIQRLRLQLYDPSGQTQRAVHVAPSAGAAAIATTVVLSGENGFSFSVTAADGSDDVQRYSVSFAATAPPTRSLSLSASTSETISVEVEPVDENNTGTTDLPATLTYVQGETVTIEAGILAGDEGFVRWVIDGVEQPLAENPVMLQMNSDRSAVALYSDSIAVDIIGNSSILLGESAVLEARAAGGVAPYTFSWSPASSLSRADVAAPTAMPDETTSYTVTVRDAANRMGSASFTVAVRELLRVNAGDDQLVVAGETSNMMGVVAGGTPPYTFQWSPVTGLANAADPESSITVLATRTYTLAVTDSLGATAQDAVRVTLVQPLSVSLGGNQTIDDGDDVTLTATVSGGQSPFVYSWSPVANDDSRITDTPTRTTDYEVLVTDASGQVAEDSARVTVRAEPLAISIRASRTNVTRGENVTLTATAAGGMPPYTVSWTPENAVARPREFSTTATIDATTTFRVTVRDEAGATATNSVVVSAGSAVTGQDVTGDPIAIAPIAGPCGLTSYSAIAFCGFWLCAARRQSGARGSARAVRRSRL